jgi:mannose-6-phosphate isomerase-like protein (cupin superfamily)
MSDIRTKSIRAVVWALLGSTALAITAVSPLIAQESESPRRVPPVRFTTPLPDVPGNHLEVVELNFPPISGAPSTVESYPGDGHHHPGSVYVYVTKGAIRIGVEGKVSVVQEGGSFFEPPLAHHMFTESASATEGATAIAVMIVPNGESPVVMGRAK